MYALTADTVPPSKIAKLIGIKLIESKELLLLLERDGFVEMAANMRSRLSVRSRENMAAVRDILGCPFIADLLPKEQIAEMRSTLLKRTEPTMSADETAGSPANPPKRRR